ncbi:DIS3-like exonuclease 2 [Dendronephthya gigantea]|uniref:DIS3-like exonuclease 2 n=1 Tax=Dendronephthya gigantea TaxID=151771 RepID=UPI001069ABD6|nr:DIS3-like exonuclease 2 [Dendronephthya gigantea]
MASPVSEYNEIILSENSKNPGERVTEKEEVDGGKQKAKKHRRKRGKKHKPDDKNEFALNSEEVDKDTGQTSVRNKSPSAKSHDVPETPEKGYDTPKHHVRQYRGKTPRHGQNRPDKFPESNATPQQSSGHHRHDTPGEHRQNSPRRLLKNEGPQTPVTDESRQNAGHSSKKKKHKKKKIYEEYWSKERVSDALKRNEIHTGSLRISAKNYEIAWVSVKGLKRDISISGMLLRNRALDGDVVALEILPKENWRIMHEEMKFHETPVEDATEKLANVQLTSEEKDIGENHVGKGSDFSKSPGKQDKINIHEVPEQYLQKTAKVVYIIEKKHTRIACGYLRPMKDPNDTDGLFSPTDSRVPRIRIAHNDCPPGFFERPQDFATTLMIVRLTEWRREAPLDSFLAGGIFARSLGEAGEIEPETDSLLLINDIDSSPFSQEVLDCLPKDLPWKIPEKELESRRDFRDVCVFTIDPATARDLDDALHCTKFDDGTFEIGVHIADVSFFVKEGTALDEVASARATSTYMVQKVIPMLPRLLCEELCSLNPDEDRLSFSVVWKMDGNGVVQDEWMGKGIIRSRVKLSYEHAQEMIDDLEKSWSEDEHPPLACGATIADIVKCVRNLNKIAVKLRRKRFENGTLRLNKAKISFDLDGKTGLPIGWHPYIQRESNKLIEEYMLLANMAVAHRIYKAFPDRAMLRCHPKPDSRQLEEVRALCVSLGINFEHQSSKGIQETLNTFPANSPEHLVLSHLSMKPMKAAKYFCAATAEGDPEEFLHYALSVPLYTHFTSPIRRYPDVIVHRLLAACLQVEPEPEFKSEDLEVVAGRCNDRKLAAKKAGEASVELYLGVFVRECGPLTEEGVVVHVLHESVDVLVPDFGIIKRIYFKFSNEVKSFEYQEGTKIRPAEVSITWKSPHDKRKSGEENEGTNESHRNDKEEATEINHRQQHRRRTEILKIFSRVRVLLKTDCDKTKNKGGLRFSGELLQNVQKE